MIKVFDDLYDAVLYIETEAEQSYSNSEYFKAELLRTSDGRWRVGFITNAQLEMFDGFQE